MTLTLVSPTSGRIGPGTGYHVTWDLVGPVVPDTSFVISIELGDHSRDMVYTQSVVTNKIFIGMFGQIPLNGAWAGPSNGLSDGASVSIRTYMVVPGSGLVDNHHNDGFTWDPTSGLWSLDIMNTSLIVSLSSGAGSKVDDILQAVRKHYTNAT